MKGKYVRILREDTKGKITGKTDDVFYIKDSLQNVLIAGLSPNVGKHVCLYYFDMDFKEGSGKWRAIEKTDVICLDFDGDGVYREWADHPNLHEKFLQSLLKALKLNVKGTIPVWTGYGLHVFLIFDGYFNPKTKKTVRVLKNFATKLKSIKHPWLEFDTGSFKTKRTMRLPGSLYQKKGRKRHTTEILSKPSEKLNFKDFMEAMDKAPILEEVSNNEEVEEKKIVLPARIDVKGVWAGCAFMHNLWDKKGDVSYEEWFAGLSITSRMFDEDSKNFEISRNMSLNEKSFSMESFKTAYQSAKSLKNPYGCAKIESIWKHPLCTSCKYYKKITTPLQIREYPNRDSGFRLRDTKANHLDAESLSNFIKGELGYITTSSGEVFKQQEGSFYKLCPVGKLLSDAQAYVFKPKLLLKEIGELKNLLFTTEVIDLKEEQKKVENLIRFKNGVFNTKDGRIYSPNTDVLHFSSIDFDFDSKAGCPKFKTFLNWAFSNSRGELKKLDLQYFLEFIGMALFAPKELKEQKALVLYGTGANGKSTLMDVIASLFSENTYFTTFDASFAKNDSQFLTPLRISKIAYCSDIGQKTFLGKEDFFKRLISKEAFTYRRLYTSEVQDIKPTAQLVLGANKLLRLGESTSGMKRRFTILGFERTVSALQMDKSLKEKLIQERAGIFNLLYKNFTVFRKRGKLFQLQSSDDLVESALMTGSFLSAFCHGFVEKVDPLNSKDFTSLRELYSAFTRYLRRCGAREFPTDRQLKRDFQECMNLTGDSYSRRSGGWGFKGIKLYKSEEAKDAVIYAAKDSSE